MQGVGFRNYVEHVAGKLEVHGYVRNRRDGSVEVFAISTSERLSQLRFALEKGVELNALTLDEVRQFGEEFEEDFYAAVTLEATLDCHDVIGGTARVRVRAALDEASRRVKALTQEAIHASA